MHPVPMPDNELALHRGGIWSRPRTYDSQIVTESGSYLRLAPDPDDVLLDIGANIGAVSWRFLNAGVRRVVAVEPEPTNFSILQKNLASTESRSVAIQAAVAAADGNGQLWVHSVRNEGMRSIVPHSGGPISVRAVTLQGLFMTYRPTLLKIDIEAGEYELMAPLSRLPTQVRGIALELHLSEVAGARMMRLPSFAVSRSRASQLCWRLGFGGQRPCTLGIWLR